MEITGKHVYVFDWDGTILDSMELKRLNFVSSFTRAHHNEDLDKVYIRKRYLELSGKPRKELFVTISSEMGIENIEDRYEDFDRQFNLLNTRSLADVELFIDAVRYIESLVENSVSLFISSSVPEGELRTLVYSILPDYLLKHFKGVLGTTNEYHKGPSHIEAICQEAGVNKSQVIFFGDDFEDYRLAGEAGVDCLVIDRENKLEGKVRNRITSFSELQGMDK